MVNGNIESFSYTYCDQLIAWFIDYLLINFNIDGTETVTTTLWHRDRDFNFVASKHTIFGRTNAMDENKTENSLNQ